jgi:hypothetical protein
LRFLEVLATSRTASSDEPDPVKSRTSPDTVRCSLSHRLGLTAIPTRYIIYSQGVCIVCALGEYCDILPPTPPCSGGCPQRQPWLADDASMLASTSSNVLAAEDLPPCAGGRGDELGGDNSGGAAVTAAVGSAAGRDIRKATWRQKVPVPVAFVMMSAGFRSVWTLTILMTKRSCATRT